MQRKGKRSESPELVLKHRPTSGNKLLSWARMIFELCCEYHGHDRANRGKFATWNKWVVKELEMLDYSPRFAWGGRPHRRFISVPERG